jgi:phosphatidylserine/phosphatidylglycerophosphate/cardiolipin synthase-like enzyme
VLPASPTPSTLAAIVAAVAQRFSDSQARTLITSLRLASSIEAGLAKAKAVIASQAFNDALIPLSHACRKAGGTSSDAIALALEVAACAMATVPQRPEVVWSGPQPKNKSIFTTAGTLFEIVQNAQHRLLLVSFSAYPIDGLVSLLAAAHERGVAIRFVLESSADSGGKLTYDAATPFKALRGRATFYVWPPLKRNAGAVLHAKALVADGKTAFVTSANLTGHAIDTNLELGLRLADTNVASEIEQHIDALIAEQILVET